MRRFHSALLTSVFALVFLAATAGPAAAQGHRRRIVFASDGSDDTLISCPVHKPEVGYILVRTPPRLGAPDLHATFGGQSIESVSGLEASGPPVRSPSR